MSYRVIYLSSRESACIVLEAVSHTTPDFTDFVRQRVSSTCNRSSNFRFVASSMSFIKKKCKRATRDLKDSDSKLYLVRIHWLLSTRQTSLTCMEASCNIHRCTTFVALIFIFLSILATMVSCILRDND